MYVESGKGYEAPQMASLYEIRMATSNPLDVIVDTDGKIGFSLGTQPLKIDLKEFLLSTPKLKNKKNWVLEPGWAAVLLTELDTPLWFNKTGKKVCMLCDGKNPVRTILEKMVINYPKQTQEDVIVDTINFMYLLKKFSLIIFKKN